jgi:hypothetical protein
LAKAETISIASVLLLDAWITQVGMPNGIVPEHYCEKVFLNILKKCDRFKTHISGTPNYFERFHEYIRQQITS